MYQVHRWSALIVGGALLTLAPIAKAADVAADYDTVNNPDATGLWEYGQYPLGPASFNLFTNSLFGGDTGAVHFWEAFAGGDSAFVSKETGGANATSGSTIWNPGDVVLRPGVNSQDAVVRFRAPAAGTYAYTVTFAPADPGGGTRTVSVVINNIVVASAPLNGAIGVALPVTLSNAAGVFLAAGSTIDYVVDDGGSPQDFDVDAAMLRNARVDFVLGAAVSKPCRWLQPWTKPWASHVSTVQNCAGNEVSWAPVALDDFVCPQNAKINRLTWWGTNPTQNGIPQRLFFIRIWRDNQQCFPEEPIFEACVEPKIKVVGIDCRQLRVFRFSTKLSPSFQAIAGQRYWLQISEVDFDPNHALGMSPTPGQPDFAWSSHRPIRDCSAIQRNTLSGFFQSPLIDPCDGAPEDLAFTLGNRFFSGTITPATNLSVYMLKLFDLNTGDLAGEFPVHPDENGEFECETDLPDGQYEMHVHGMATVGGILATVVVFSVDSFFHVNLPLKNGDADNDGKVIFADVNAVLGNWLAEFGIINGNGNGNGN